ncbi:CFEM domain-containing protein [Aspergillus undulatus]|uniref:CFEM domain-containing protein n=1 Tax=Aspergillus undulatus TaxID=1810928 RepID=UPI003CCE5384
MDAIPKCAAACLVQALPSSSCSPADISCMCLDQQLISQTLACGLQSCSIKEGLLSQRALYTVCDWPVSEDKERFPIVLIAGIILSFLSVALRVAVRLITSNIGLDDSLILLSLGAVIGIAGLGLENQRLGLGEDMWFLPFEDITKFLHYYFTIETLYIASIALTKISMLLLYLRLFPEKRMRTTIYVTLAFTTAWGVAMLFANIFSCTPVSYIWTLWDGEHEGSCINHEKVIWSHAIMNIFFDIAIIALPMPTLFKLNMSVRKKVGVVVMFAVGLLVTAVSIVRCIELLRFDMNDNPTKNIVGVSIFSVVEVDLSIICACMPGIRAFISYIRKAIWGERKTTTGSYTYGKGYGNSSRFSTVRRTPAPGETSSNLIPRPEAVRSGTFETDADGYGDAKQGEFIALQETRVESRAESRAGSRSRNRSMSRGQSRAKAGAGVGIAIETQIEVESESESQYLDHRRGKAWFDT